MKDKLRLALRKNSSKRKIFPGSLHLGICFSLTASVTQLIQQYIVSLITFVQPLTILVNVEAFLVDRNFSQLHVKAKYKTEL